VNVVRILIDQQKKDVLEKGRDFVLQGGGDGGQQVELMQEWLP